MSYICSEIEAPCLANNVEGGKTPILDAARLEEIGYAAVAFPVSAAYVTAKALHGFFAALRDKSGDSLRLCRADAELLPPSTTSSACRSCASRNAPATPSPANCWNAPLS